MISRREVVTAGVLGTLAGPGSAEAAPAQQSQDNGPELDRIKTEIANLRTTLEKALIGPSLSSGFITDIREKYLTHLRTSGKFPDFMEVGLNVFMDVYDWHVRHQQQVQMTRINEQRFTIVFMFTSLIVRWDQDRNYIGVPFDKA